MFDNFILPNQTYHKYWSTPFNIQYESNLVIIFTEKKNYSNVDIKLM